MARPIDFVIKLGGSAITEKSCIETEKISIIVKTCRFLKECHGEGKSMIVVHGAGSFGHHHAKKYNVRDGYMDKPEDSDVVKGGFCATRLSVLKLQAVITEAMFNEGLNVVSLSPCGSWLTKDGCVIVSGVSTIYDFVQKGFVPLVHGDCVLDSVRGCTILSGDTIIETICREVPVKLVVFLMDVDGVYNKPPYHHESYRIPQLSVSRSGELTESVGVSVHEDDVTGGMGLKLQTAVSIVTGSSIETSILLCEIGSDVARRVCLQGVDQTNGEGTLVLPTRD